MRAPLAAAAIDETAATIASETAFILPAGFDAQRNACGRRRRASIRNTRGEIEKKVGEALFMRADEVEASAGVLRHAIIDALRARSRRAGAVVTVLAVFRLDFAVMTGGATVLYVLMPALDRGACRGIAASNRVDRAGFTIIAMSDFVAADGFMVTLNRARLGAVRENDVFGARIAIVAGVVAVALLALAVHADRAALRRATKEKIVGARITIIALIDARRAGARRAGTIIAGLALFLIDDAVAADRRAVLRLVCALDIAGGCLARQDILSAGILIIAMPDTVLIAGVDKIADHIAGFRRTRDDLPHDAGVFARAHAFTSALISGSRIVTELSRIELTVAAAGRHGLIGISIFRGRDRGVLEIVLDRQAHGARPKDER